MFSESMIDEQQLSAAFELSRLQLSFGQKLLQEEFPGIPAPHKNIGYVLAATNLIAMNYETLTALKK